jgi:hypothetical protein
MCKRILLMLAVLGLAACDEETKSTIPGEATDSPMTGGTIQSPPPATAPTTQGTKPIIDPQEIPADRAGLKDNSK